VAPVGPTSGPISSQAAPSHTNASLAESIQVSPVVDPEPTGGPTTPRLP